MKRSTIIARSNLQSRDTYVCLSCQLRRYTIRPSSLTNKLPVSNVENGRNKKSIRTSISGDLSNRRYASVATDQTQQDIPEYNFSIRSKPNSKPSLGSASANTLIRQSLRAWNTQNDTITRSNAPKAISAEGRISQLPSAIFIGKNNSVDDTEPLEDRTEFEDNEEFGAPHFIDAMAPGTLFSFESSMTARQYAVLVDHVGVQTLLALESGAWTLEKTNHIRRGVSNYRRAHMPGFLDHKELRDLREYLPKNNVERPIADSEEGIAISVRGPINPRVIKSFMSKMSAFRQEVEDHERCFRRLSETAYDRVAAEGHYQLLPLSEYVQRGFDINWLSLSPSAKMAMANILNEQDFVSFSPSSGVQLLLVMSKKMRSNHSQVVHWARQYQDAAAQAAVGKNMEKKLGEIPLTAFISKARHLILKSRKLRTPTTTGSLGPSAPQAEVGSPQLEKIPTDVSFTETDKMIIDYIWTTCYRAPAPIQNATFKFTATLSLILRAVGAYPQLPLRQHVGQLFLKELGCVDPWESSFRDDLTVPLSNGLASQKTDQLKNELDQYAREFVDMADRGEVEQLDSMASLRKDWGNLPAFAIDEGEGISAEDAISIEKSDELEDAYWIHVHVCHLSAYFHPSSIVGRFAKNQGLTLYEPGAPSPNWMISEPISKHFALRRGSSVSTISTLIREDGHVLAITRSVGKIHNLIKLRRSAVQKVLQSNELFKDEQISQLIVGQVKDYKPREISDQDIQNVLRNQHDLKTLKRLLESRVIQRKAELPYPVSLPRATYHVQINVTGVQKVPVRCGYDSYHWKGDPGIAVLANQDVNFTTALRYGDDLVTNAMWLAGESNARWLDERNIPAIFIGSHVPPGHDGRQAWSGDIGQESVKLYHVRSASAQPYLVKYMKSYCSMTSPVRRYVDTVAHWQADSYLRAVAAKSISFDAKVMDESILAFTKQEICDYLNTEAHGIDALETKYAEKKVAFVLSALHRAFHFKEAVLPEVLEVIIAQPMRYNANLTVQEATGTLIPFGINCILVESGMGWEKAAKFRQYVPVRIEEISLNRMVAVCKPIGPPTNEQQYKDAFRAIPTPTSKNVY